QENGLFRRFTEEQEQFVYSVDEVREFAEKAGMEFVACYDAFSDALPREDSERIYIVLRERGKHE
ncbi:MAG: class I SAM-dependent methyltransferase, partial [Lachnospiraceae bacterium]|nr:class I SAM-dependent methyltransferase [Lachnospiraceae bacterium]